VIEAVKARKRMRKRTCLGGRVVDIQEVELQSAILSLQNHSKRIQSARISGLECWVNLRSTLPNISMTLLI